MKIYQKIFACTLAAGAVLCFTGLSMANFDLSAFGSGGRYETKHFSPQDEITSLRIESRNADIRLEKTDGDFEIEYSENRLVRYTLTVENGVLTFSPVPVKWYQGLVNFSPDTPSPVTIRLDKEIWENISLTTDNGDITGDLPLSATSFIADTDNGNVNFSNLTVSGDAAFSSDNGNVRLAGTDCSGGLSAETDNGDLYLSKISCSGPLSAETDNGDVQAETLSASEITLSSATGDIAAETIHAETGITLETDLGDIRGSVTGAREDYAIRAASDLGSCNLTNSDSGEKSLTVTTDLGDIEIYFLG